MMTLANALPGHLDVGAHLGPDEGACLMEAVSAAAGEPWSDAPACTHPLVAHVARLVNDTVGDRARDELLALVPQLTVPSRRDPASYAEVAHACTGYALGFTRSLLLVHLHLVAERQLRPAGRGAAGRRLMPDAWFRHGPAFRAVEAAVGACVGLPAAERDERLTAMLRRAVRVAVEPPARLGTASAPPRGLPVHSG
jgi:hypothetical protein